MIKLSGVSLPPDTDFSDLKALASRLFSLDRESIASCSLWKKSVDARRGVSFVCSFVLTLSAGEQALLARSDLRAVTFSPPVYVPVRPGQTGRPVVVAGSGPAGLFCALELARAGCHVTLLERGQPLERRVAAVEALWTAGTLDESTNAQFGEGGAGTFSDGKLSTGIGDERCRHVLETFVCFGAPEDILYLARPHIGTDLLRGVIRAMRLEIERLGGAVLFSHRLDGLSLDRGVLTGVFAATPDGRKELRCDRLVLAVGHSARDTIEALSRQGLALAQKSFSLGARIEHLQRDIDAAQFGQLGAPVRHPALPPAEYALSVHLPSGRSAYTFCMCPGGSVIAAASAPGGVVTNGMSLHARSGQNANAAVLVGVTPADFGSDDPLAGFALQERIERAAFAAAGGGYHAPAQTVGDFLAGRPTKRFGRVEPSYRPRVTPGNLRDCLPGFVADAMAEALVLLGRKLRGFDSPDAVLTAPETRSSSPVRMPRGADRQGSIAGVYPCGEGAGYAGGILSAAVDGIKTAEAVLTSLA